MPMRITENVTWQEENENIADLVRTRTLATDLTIHHAVNLYRPRDSDGLGQDQLVTIESMRRALRFAALDGVGLAVEHVAVHDERDADAMPDDFRSGGALRRTVRDLPGFPEAPPLPLLFDILDAVAAVAARPEPTHVIFTNADICIQPDFYLFVQRAISAGFDSLIINRRTLQGDAIDVPLSVAGADFGATHPGLDCFVFPYRWIREFVRSDACVGAGFVMRSLLPNLVALADALLVVTAAQLTFHFGNDRPWKSETFAPLQDHNLLQAKLVHERLSSNARLAARLDAFHNSKPKYRPPTDRSRIRP